MTTQSDVATLLPIITPYTLPEGDEGLALYNHTVSRVLMAAPSLEENDGVLTEAVCYLIAHILSMREGRTGVTSEHLGQWSASYSWGESTPWLTEYKRIVNGISKANIIRASRLMKHADRHKADCLSMDNTFADACCRDAIWERDSYEY